LTSLLAFCVTEKFSGGEKYTIDLLASLAERGWRVSLVGCDNEELETACSNRGIRFVRSKLGPKLGKKTVLRVMVTWLRKEREFFALVHREDADVVLLQYKLEQLLWAGKHIGSGVVLLEHGAIPVWIRRLRPVYRRYCAAVRSAENRFAASRPAQEAFASIGFDSTILSAGVDKPRVASAITRAGTTRQQMLNLAHRSKLGIYAGRLTEGKGIVATARALAGSPDVALFIAGAGPAEAELREIAASAENIVLLGSLADPYPYIAASDFGVLMTQDPGEGRPLFAIECLALGVPVVGNASSPAMISLNAEFGDAIHLASREELSELSSFIARVGPTKANSHGWGEAAFVFEREISRVAAR